MNGGVSLITLGVMDLGESLAFYERLGYAAAPESIEGGVAFFQINGLVLGLYPMAALAQDISALAAPPNPGGMTLGRNFNSVEAMEAAHAAFLDAGGRQLRTPFDAPWGRISYAADPDGHVWEFAHVPGFEPDAAGGLTLPSARGEDA